MLRGHYTGYKITRCLLQTAELEPLAELQVQRRRPPRAIAATWSRNADVLKAGEEVSYTVLFRVFLVVRRVF